MKRVLVGSVAALVLLMGEPSRVSAHQVQPDPVVEVFVKPDGGRLSVLVKLPAAVLADAKLARDDSGRLIPESNSQALQLVGADIASNLEVRQGAELLLSPTIATTIASTGESVDVALTYAIRAGTGNISARLRTFRAGTGMVRTVAHYDAPPSPARTFVVNGDPERVAFDPGPVEAMRTFVARGTAWLLSSSDYLLFALCLALPVRGKGALGTACAAFLAGEIVIVLASSVSGFLAAPSVLISAELVTASAIVVAALQVITNPRSRWLSPLALIFGLALGSTTGAAFVRDSSFAGAHVATALLAFVLVVTLGQVWAIALLSSAASVLFRWGLPERIAAFTVAVLAAHQALHRIADRVESLAQLGVGTPDRILMTITLAWASLVLCAAIIEIMAGRHAGTFVTPPLADRRGGSR